MASGASTSLTARRGESGRERRFELRCADVHPYRCEAVFSGANPAEVIALAQEHGAQVHYFTPVYYRAERLDAMASAVVSRPC